MSAKRLPGKPLLQINGKSIISRVLLKAKSCRIGEVIVATPDQEIMNEIKKYNGKVVLTSKKHKSGTDRIWEAYKKIKDKSIKYIINLQGDEPTINIIDIKKLNKIVIKNKIDICTLASKLHNKSLKNKNVVKVITKNKISYSSVSKAKLFARNLKKKQNNTYHHIGIYHYSVSALKKFCSLNRSKNEIKNKLEQLRALDNNMTINVLLAKKQVIGIDTKQDYMELKKKLEYKA
tara:strand:+ start:157 stop:858 length:702 start_codon:yes stop_codon:yes gene_type:complete